MPRRQPAAFTLGWEACQRGWLLEENPYFVRDWKHAEWLAGWHECERVKVKAMEDLAEKQAKQRGKRR